MARSLPLLGRLRGRVSFRTLAAATVAMTYLTILLGVATKAAGAGLACEARWPVCDGGLLNLFPATVPSFFEWIHRVVAGATGFFILGTAAWAWFGGTDDRRIHLVATLGLVLLPVQVLLGRQTVLEFTMPILTAHYWVAMTIFGSFAAAAAFAWSDRLAERHVGRALAVAAGAVPVQLLFSAQMLSSYSPPVQTAHYAATLVVVAALVTATVAARARLASDHLVRSLATAALVIVPVQILLGRRALIEYSETLLTAHAAVSGLLVVVLAAALVTFYRSRSGRSPSLGVES